MAITLNNPVTQPATEEKTYDLVWLNRMMFRSPINRDGVDVMIGYSPARLTESGYETDGTRNQLQVEVKYADFEAHGVDITTLNEGQKEQLLFDIISSIVQDKVNA